MTSSKYWFWNDTVVGNIVVYIVLVMTCPSLINNRLSKMFISLQKHHWFKLFILEHKYRHFFKRIYPKSLENENYSMFVLHSKTRELMYWEFNPSSREWDQWHLNHQYYTDRAWSHKNITDNPWICYNNIPKAMTFHQQTSTTIPPDSQGMIDIMIKNGEWSST